MIGDAMFRRPRRLVRTYLVYISRRRSDPVLAAALVCVASAMVIGPLALLFAPARSRARRIGRSRGSSLFQGDHFRLRRLFAINYAVLAVGSRPSACCPLWCRSRRACAKWIAGDRISDLEWIAIAAISCGVMIGCVPARALAFGWRRRGAAYGMLPPPSQRATTGRTECRHGRSSGRGGSAIGAVRPTGHVRAAVARFRQVEVVGRPPAGPDAPTIHNIRTPGDDAMDVRAAVAHKAGAPLTIETVQLAGPKAGEVLIEIKATGICHTDEFTRSGADPEGLFPAILGHEGAGIVVDIGAGVTSVRKGDHVIPLYTPECRQCKSCLSRKTNLCTAIRATQGKGLMPDGTSRFSLDGKPLSHYMGCSTFANFTVLPEIAVAKIREDARSTRFATSAAA
jgi:hypothetical protein